MTNLTRRIRTRCFEALLNETRNCFARDITVATPDGPMSLQELYSERADLKIYGYPLHPAESIRPRQINITPAPMSFSEGVGGISDTDYDFEVTFIFPIEVIFYKAGQGLNTYLDEIDEFKTWLLQGGSVPNKNARLQDPDNPGSVINLSIEKFAEQRWTPAPNQSGIEVPIIVGFGTREDRTGARA